VKHPLFQHKEPWSKTPEQDENIAGSEDSNDYSEPNQTSELIGTSEAVTAPDTPEAATTPDVPNVEAFEEAHNDSQQVIQSKNSFKYKSSHPEDKSLTTKKVPEELDHISDQKSLPWDCCPC